MGVGCGRKGGGRERESNAKRVHRRDGMKSVPIRCSKAFVVACFLSMVSGACTRPNGFQPPKRLEWGGRKCRVGDCHF